MGFHTATPDDRLALAAADMSRVDRPCTAFIPSEQQSINPMLYMERSNANCLLPLQRYRAVATPCNSGCLSDARCPTISPTHIVRTTHAFSTSLSEILTNIVSLLGGIFPLYNAEPLANLSLQPNGSGHVTYPHRPEVQSLFHGQRKGRQ
ncbi:hypothetical protein KC349_g228 [Hortaea werneckii]|nr:hypothetical protein KC349_g228 [Hortaea werneckii]